MQKKHTNQLAVALLGFLLTTSCSKNDLSSPGAEKDLNNTEVGATSSAKSPGTKTQTYKYDLSIPLDGWYILGYCLGEQIILSGQFRSRVHGVIYPDYSIKEVVLVIEGGKAISESGREYRFKAASVEKATTKKLGVCTLAFEYHINYRLLSNGSNDNLYLKIHSTGFFDLCTQTNYGYQKVNPLPASCPHKRRISFYHIKITSNENESNFRHSSDSCSDASIHIMSKGCFK